ncbi:exopolyphosphatase [Alkaliphilus serpentinus]|uniref:Exopolyphosphatase n=1 Tax=Alkaliphilus serpentinus TaxID=1482731 RepID=A0A833HQE3_9FIRM|nr:exopolyphosphatase [Alkaliphilus serpentinus]KAB3531786.1 exopolyphosphatase [Alkaliphilus serpentinus]
MAKKYAIIDLGSNSVRMIIMKIFNDNSYKLIDQVKEMVRLSEGMGEEKTLKPLAIKRTMEALKFFKKLIEVHSVDNTYMVATAAVRNATNQEFFLEKVKQEVGFDFTVITGKEEAYYAYLGVINTIDIEDCVMIDIGGASTEIGWIQNRRLKESISLPFGAVIMTEKFMLKDKISSQRLKRLEEFFKKEFSNIPWLKETQGLPVVGLGGTIRALAKIDRNRVGFNLISLHNYQMNLDEVSYGYNLVSRANYQERKNIPGVNKERADIIVGGLVPIRYLLEYIKSDKLIISGNGLREGVFYHNYLKEYYKKAEILEDVLYHSIENNLKNYDVNIKHSNHVKNLALSIFDQTTKLHKMGREARRLLSVAALLHDIGSYVDYYNHHKHGFYLVLNSRINGLRNRQLLMCAFIVANHREIPFKEDWRKYSTLINKADYEAIKKLSIFLRIAEQLDRSEFGSVEEVACYLTEDCLQIMVKSPNSPELEIETAMKAEGDFKKLFNRRLVIV